MLDKHCRGTLQGTGATQLFNVSLYISRSMISKNTVSSMDGVGLLSESVSLKTLRPRVFNDAWHGRFFCSPPRDTSSVRFMKPLQGLRIEGWPFYSTFVLNMPTAGLCLFPKHTSPTRTHPISIFHAKGCCEVHSLAVGLYRPSQCLCLAR